MKSEEQLPENQINLTTAKAWTKEWRDIESDYNEYNECNGFLVPLADLKEVVAEMAKLPPSLVPQYVRAYLGVEVNNDIEPSVKTEKLIIVGTKPGGIVDDRQVYIDMISDDLGNPVSGGGGGIWDFTNPCPPWCDPNSPLN